jgi:metal-responsive CopG/Arc/MetJ family transcriptional regulator
MKTAVSIPDHIFREAERTARELGMPRSRLVARALEEFISRYEKERVTEQLNAVYENAPPTPLQEPESSIVSLRRLTADDTW